MTTQPPQLIALDMILVPESTPLNEDTVKEIAESITEIGHLINPVTIRKDFRLVAGRHRIAAFRKLGRGTIPCIVLDLDDLRARLATIDENYIRNHGTVLERLSALEERKQVYEAIHPTTRQHVAGGKARHKPATAESAVAERSFAKDTAKKTNRSERTVREEVQIAKALTKQTQKAIEKTPIADSKTELLKLAKVEPEKQKAAAKKLASGEAKTVSQAVRAVERDERTAERHAKAEAAPEPCEDDTWRIIEGDSVDELKKLESGTVRFVFTDPPYNIGRDYGDGGDGDSQSDDDYLAFCQRWMAQCARLLTPDGTLLVMINKLYAGRYDGILRGLGLNFRHWLIWRETFGVYTANNFTDETRHLLYFTKSKKEFVFNQDVKGINIPSDRQTKYGDARANPTGKTRGNWFDVPRIVGTSKEKVDGHDNQLPLELVTPFVECFSDPGDLVIDPFNGTGTTGAACIETARRYIGIERSAESVRRATVRLRGAMGSLAVAT